MIKSLVEYIKTDMKSYRLMNFQIEYTQQAKEIGTEGKLITAEQHSAMSEMDFSSHYESVDSWISWYFGYLSNINKLDLIPIVYKYLNENDSKKLVSFGAGPGVIEYFISTIMQDNIEILATDYDDFFVKNGNSLMDMSDGGVRFEKFDFYYDSIAELKTNFDFDIVLMMGSACGMDNKTYKKFLSELRENGIKTIITFEAGIFNDFGMIVSGIRLFTHAVVRYILGYKNRSLYSCHAWRRSKSELMRIYRSAGFKHKRLKKTIYKYAYILEVEK